MAIIGSVVLQDDLYTTISKRYEMEAITLAQALTDIGVLLATLPAVSDLGVVSVTFSQKDISEAYAAQAGSNVDVGATFRLRLTSGKLASHRIPGFPQAKVGGNRAVDPNDADVQAYFANFAPAGAFKLSDGETMDEVISGTFDV